MLLDNFKPVKRRPVNTKNGPPVSKIEVKKAPDFDLPEEAAENDEQVREKEVKSQNTSTKKSKNFITNISKKQWIIVGAIIVFIVSGGAGAYFKFHKKPIAKAPIAKVVPKPPPPPPPTNEDSTLTGLKVPIGANKLPVTGVMIENSPDARPQSGLLDAGVVFEAIAEGGITRFLALFQSDSTPDYIGPVRSARPYYLDYLSGFDAAIAHVGGSTDAINQSRSQGIKDLDQFANSGAYRRISSRYAPHNVYTSMADLYGLQKAKGFSSKYVGFARRPEIRPAITPTAKSIDMTISGYYYNTHYDYDVASNSYNRSEGGKPHTDERSGKQLNSKVVIAIVVPQTIAADRIHSIYQDFGSGKAFVFQDGIEVDGTWTKADRTAQIQFTDANGKVMTLNPGQTWITLISNASSVSFKP